jgi:hypothetical protein
VAAAACCGARHPHQHVASGRRPFGRAIALLLPAPGVKNKVQENEIKPGASCVL